MSHLLTQLEGRLLRLRGVKEFPYDTSNVTSLLLLSPKFSLKLRHLSSAERTPPFDTALSKFPVVPLKCLVGIEARCPALLPSHSFPRSLQQRSLGKKTNTRMKYLRNLKSNKNGNIYNLYSILILFLCYYLSFKMHISIQTLCSSNSR